MFDRYSQLALQVVFLARLSAGDRGVPDIGIEDLLHGLVRADETLFVEAGIDSTELRSLANTLRVGSPVPTAQDLPVTTHLKQSFNRAREIADQMQCAEIRTEHLLLGLMEQKVSNTADILAPFSAALESWRSSASLIDCNKPQEAKEWSSISNGFPGCWQGVL